MSRCIVLKDLPTDLPAGLILAVVPKRLDARDVLISRKRWSLKTLPRGPKWARAVRAEKDNCFWPGRICSAWIFAAIWIRASGAPFRKKKYDAIVVARAGLLRLKKISKNMPG